MLSSIQLSTVQHSVWYAFGKITIQALLCSSENEERKVGVQKIIELRSGNDFLEDLSVPVCHRKIPSINLHATSLLELIDWSQSIYEPLLTCKLTILEVKNFINDPMQVPEWPCHGQSVERIAQQVTEAADKVHTV
ncbi:hypothetical protein JRQ81_013631 [Phrynocephalus forsythii]|uniref:Uncharacterized protein n=1 Tax=Phrynocephalus forsythii TaxID=171643 RepID=A0A9Q0XZJ7_9SAUR|nr:hypothetical protein JRQ81_013631 [Phrynocephalus forsythii]